MVRARDIVYVDSQEVLAKLKVGDIVDIFPEPGHDFCSLSIVSSIKGDTYYFATHGNDGNREKVYEIKAPRDAVRGTQFGQIELVLDKIVAIMYYRGNKRFCQIKSLLEESDI